MDFLSKVIEGNRRYVAEQFQHQPQLKSLADGQAPPALFVTCTDSRVDPTLITQTGPGEMFIERNPGNLAPVYADAHTGGVSASIEFAAAILNVRHIIICGHTDCGAIKALLHPEQYTHLPAVAHWTMNARKARERVLREFADATEQEQLQALTAFNVEEQLENLSTHPSVRRRLDAGNIYLSGFVYSLKTGEMRLVKTTVKHFECEPIR